MPLDLPTRPLAGKGYIPRKVLRDPTSAPTTPVEGARPKLSSSSLLTAPASARPSTTTDSVSPFGVTLRKTPQGSRQYLRASSDRALGSERPLLAPLLDTASDHKVSSAPVTKIKKVASQRSSETDPPTKKKKKVAKKKTTTEGNSNDVSDSPTKKKKVVKKKADSGGAAESPKKTKVSAKKTAMHHQTGNLEVSARTTTPGGTFNKGNVSAAEDPTSSPKISLVNSNNANRSAMNVSKPSKDFRRKAPLHLNSSEHGVQRPDSKETLVYIESKEHGWVPGTQLLINREQNLARVEIPPFSSEEEMGRGSAAKLTKLRRGGPKSAAGTKPRENIVTVDLGDYPNKVLPLQNVTSNGRLEEYKDMVELPFLHEVSMYIFSTFIFELLYCRY